MEFTLLAAAFTAVATIWVAVRLLGRSGGPIAQIHRPTDLLIGAAAMGIFTGRLASMIGTGVNPLTHPLDILLIRGGVDTGFASLGALAALAWASRDAVPWVADALVAPALAGLGGWHAGCLWRGTCLGTVSEVWWAWSEPGSSVTRHPVELYAAGLFLLAAWAITRLPGRAWVATGAGLASAGLIRLVTEPLRLSLAGGPVGWYLAAVVIGLSLAAYGLTRASAV